MNHCQSLSVKSVAIALSALVLLTGCRGFGGKPPLSSPLPSVNTSDLKLSNQRRREILDESWKSYRQRFIQPDGRVIDWESDQRTTSEGQAYAMLRAVLANDPETFSRTLNWAEVNLARKVGGKRSDRLWTWKWGRTPLGQWGVLDGNFASDADIDACFSLILASKRWNKPDYLVLARQKLEDLWQFSTLEVKQQRYLLPGPEVAFRQGETLIFNPSYFAPYAFRLFAQVDGERDWLKLIDSSYRVLEDSATLSSVGLPSDWVGLNLKTQRYESLKAPLLSQYGFDASRVWWRVALDGAIYNEPRAMAYLKQHTTHLRQLWLDQGKIPAQISLQGQPLVDYDATSQYGMLFAAMELFDPAIANNISQKKLLPRYQQGFWDNDAAYYTQNLVWFGLLPAEAIGQAMSPP
ncbi:MAG: glycosyl hydrolase [Alkalinema sp. RU_4_3]|nr:glycosyl hydrolase [Alkalinema sp. RU_4_3]